MIDDPDLVARTILLRRGMSPASFTAAGSELPKYISAPSRRLAPRISCDLQARDYPFAMASSVSGKIAFVTGGASGIGAALTTKLVDGGAEVWIADRQIGAAQELAQRLSGGAKTHAIELDVRSYPSFERAVAEAVQHLGGSTTCSTMPAS